MLNELKTFKPSTVTSNFEHVVQEIGVPELTSIFSQKLVLLPLSETSPLYGAEDFPEQYEPVLVDETAKKVTHYCLKTGNSDESISLTPYFLEYLETGKVTEHLDEYTDNVHMIPLPIYPVISYLGQYVPCVALKDGTRALINGDNIIKGVKLQ